MAGRGNIFARRLPEDCWIRRRRLTWRGGGFVFLGRRTMSSRRDSAGEKPFGVQGEIAEELSAMAGLSGTAPEFWCSAGTGPEVVEETTGSLLEVSTVISLTR